MTIIDTGMTTIEARDLLVSTFKLRAAENLSRLDRSGDPGGFIKASIEAHLTAAEEIAAMDPDEPCLVTVASLGRCVNLHDMILGAYAPDLEGDLPAYLIQAAGHHAYDCLAQYGSRVDTCDLSFHWGGGFMLVDKSTNAILRGGGQGFQGESLDDILRFVSQPEV